jgi:F-type H+-transporting ATPase subunit delta
MSETITLARPYARAVFSMASERGRLPQWSAMLAFAGRAVSEPAVQSMLGDPRLDAQVLAGVLAPPGEADTDFGKFLAVLADNGRLALLPGISTLYDAQRAEAEHVVKATITSASALDADELAKLSEALRKRFGSDVEVTTAVDAALIGGAVIDAGDVVIDGSLRTKLARLGAALAS